MKDLELQDMEFELEELQKAIQNKKYDLVFDVTGLQPKEIIFGDWDCDKSPIGTCVYDRVEDPACDCCVFCNEPDDRR